MINNIFTSPSILKCHPHVVQKAAQNSNSKHIQPSADVGTKRCDECFPARSRLDLKHAPHPGTFDSRFRNYLERLRYPHPSVMGWAGRDKLSNQKIEGSISGCDNLIRQLIYINVCTAWWCRWAFAYIFFCIPGCLLTSRGRMQSFGVPERNLAKTFPSSALSLCCQKEEENNATLPFLSFPANNAAMFCLSFLVNMEGQRGNMSKSQFWLSTMTARVNMLLFLRSWEFLPTCCLCTKFAFPMWFFSTNQRWKEWYIDGLFLWYWAVCGHKFCICN